jgi:hypothetical protein
VLKAAPSPFATPNYNLTPCPSSTAIACNMPPDRTRIGNAHGRQKSCSECAKGKRKCDLSYPSCARCRKQDLTCAYPQPPRRRPSATSAGNPRHDLNGFEVPEVSMGLQDLENLELLPLDFEVHSLPPAPGTDQDAFDLEVGIASLDSLSNMLYNEEDQLAVERVHHRVEKRFSAAHIDPFARSRVEWSIGQLKLTPKMMVDLNGTPWQHCMLYSEYMPRPLQDAHAACARYLAPTGKCLLLFKAPASETPQEAQFVEADMYLLSVLRQR